MCLQHLNPTHRFQVVVKITQILVNLVVLYCIDNLIGKYLYNNRGVWGAEPPSAGGEKPAAGAGKFSTIAITPPLRLGKKRVKGGFYSAYP